MVGSLIKVKLWGAPFSLASKATLAGAECAHMFALENINDVFQPIRNIELRKIKSYFL